MNKKLKGLITCLENISKEPSDDKELGQFIQAIKTIKAHHTNDDNMLVTYIFTAITLKPNIIAKSKELKAFCQNLKPTHVSLPPAIEESLTTGISLDYTPPKKQPTQSTP